MYDDSGTGLPRRASSDLRYRPGAASQHHIREQEGARGGFETATRPDVQTLRRVAAALRALPGPEQHH